jgi:hypothetical protein
VAVEVSGHLALELETVAVEAGAQAQVVLTTDALELMVLQLHKLVTVLQAVKVLLTELWVALVHLRQALAVAVALTTDLTQTLL